MNRRKGVAVRVESGAGTRRTQKCCAQNALPSSSECQNFRLRLAALAIIRFRGSSPAGSSCGRGHIAREAGASEIGGHDGWSRRASVQRAMR